VRSRHSPHRDARASRFHDTETPSLPALILSEWVALSRPHRLSSAGERGDAELRVTNPPVGNRSDVLLPPPATRSDRGACVDPESLQLDIPLAGLQGLEACYARTAFPSGPMVDAAGVRPLGYGLASLY
jgi:hypothetical protein